MKISLAISLLISPLVLVAQDNLEARVSSVATISTSRLQPHWFHSNKWGLNQPFGYANFNVSGYFNYALVTGRHFNLDAGAGVLFREPLNESFLHQAYLGGNLLFVDFVIGKKAFSPLAHRDHLGTGSYLMSSNARPIPKVSFGIFEYVQVPFINNWLDIKGYGSIGYLNENPVAGVDPDPDITGNVWCHEKFLYLRLGKFFLKPYVGLTHVALFGGERYDGTRIPVDFWATFLARGSEVLGEGELTNAAGAHDGFWDFGFDAEFNFGKMHLGMRKPFSDRNGYVLKHAFRRNHDYIFTWHLELDRGRLVNQVLVEFVRTDHQSGPGIPDPMFPPGHERAGHLIFPWLIGDWNEFMTRYFPNLPVPEGGWTVDAFERHWEINYNQGHFFGGRADNLNNGFYYRSYTYHGQSMGTSLFHTYQTVREYAPGWDPNNHGIFINNRVRALHLGIAGQFSDRLKYRLKATHSLNYGNWGEKFLNRYSWELTPGYFFATIKNQTYTMLELSYDGFNPDYLSLTGSFGADFGELYNSIGINVGLNYRF